MTTKELLELKEQLTSLEQEVAENKGALKAAQAQLREKGFKTVKEAEQALDKLNAQVQESTEHIQEMETKIRDMLEEVK